AAVVPTVDGGSGTGFLVVTAWTGPDTLRVSKGSDVRIYQVNSPGSVDANSIEELDVDLGAGADTISIDTLNNSIDKVVSINTGQIVTDTGQTVLVPDPDDPNIKVKQPVLIFTQYEAPDTITIGRRNDVLGADRVTGGPGLDTFFDDSLLGSGDIDTLVETQNADMSLFQNTFVVGTLLADDGVTPFANSAYADTATLINGFRTQDDPT